MVIIIVSVLSTFFFTTEIQGEEKKNIDLKEIGNIIGIYAR